MAMRLLCSARRVGLSYCRVRYKSKTATKQLEDTRPSRWQSVIGLEIHAQIATESKLFSAAGTQFAAPTNSQVSFFDAALPGTLPVLNCECVKAGVKTALALNSNINLVSKFDRKHYFYADLPAGYQITQQRQPLATGGHLSFPVYGGRRRGKALYDKTIRITQVQLEQDSGKSLHDAEESHSLIDLNRAGIALLEIVTEPDFVSGEEAAVFVKEFARILELLGVCNANMSEGNLRVDASVSLHLPGEPLGQRAEVKNLNSTKSVCDAIEYEIQRQTEVLENGGEVTNETRSYDADYGVTVPMRDKERLHDYRFLPEPNLPPLRLYTNETVHDGLDPSQVINVDKIHGELPEMPVAQRRRLQANYGLIQEKSIVLVNEPGMLQYFDAAVKAGQKNIQELVNLLLTQVLTFFNQHDMTMKNFRVTPAQFSEIVDLVSNQFIARSNVNELLLALQNGESQSPREIAEQRGWRLITDLETLQKVCQEVLEENPKAVEEYRKGKTKVFNFLVGSVMKKTKGKVSTELLTPTLKDLLK